MKYLLLLMLAGCGSQKVLPDVVLAPETKVVNIDRSLLVECPALAKLEKPEYTQGELVKAVNDSWVKESDKCRAQLSILIKAVKKAFNIK